MDNPKKDGEAGMGKRVPMAKSGVATRGKSIPLSVNHFKVTVSKTDGVFYHYSVAIKYEDGNPVEVNGIWRKILSKLMETKSMNFAYDGDAGLISTELYPIIESDEAEFAVILEDARNIGSRSAGADDNDPKRLKTEPPSKKYTVCIKYAKSIPIQSIMQQDKEHPEYFQEALRGLNVILRHHAAQQGCLLVRQSFFRNEVGKYMDLGGGVCGCKGFHSSFGHTQGGLSLNMDVSTTMIVRPGSLIKFLLLNQKVDDHAQLDWTKAGNTLKNLRVKVPSSGMEYKISGLSKSSCKEQKFLFKKRSEPSEAPEVEITVYNYFTQHRKIKLEISVEMRCVDVGKPTCPTYFPLEPCELVPLQRYTNPLSDLQRASLVEQSVLGPKDIVLDVEHGCTIRDYAADPLFTSCGVQISTKFTKVEGRELTPPKLKVGSEEVLTPSNGMWDLKKGTFAKPMKIDRWAVVNFSGHSYEKDLYWSLIDCARTRGMTIDEPDYTFDEREESKGKPASMRVHEIIRKIKSKFTEAPEFLLCILPNKKNSDLYGPWKKACLCEIGVVTQCIAPKGRRDITNMFLNNVVLKINVKLGGLNWLLTMERSSQERQHGHAYSVYKTSTLIIGMDVCHGSPARDTPSIAAVVSSRAWPLISKYRATVRSQPAKSEIIEGLFKPVSTTEDEGIFRELLTDFIRSSRNRRPDQIIIFRDGVSESQFNQVLNVELEQIIQACKFLDEKWSPKFMLVVAQKNHHTKILRAMSSADNVPPGTVIDKEICHPTSNDFYMCAHAVKIGTTRPTHYHVLYDDLGYSPDDFQELVHSLSYVYQRSTTAISVVAPIRYAHLAAAQVSQIIKLDEGAPPVPELPILHWNVRSSMFFC